MVKLSLSVPGLAHITGLRRAVRAEHEESSAYVRRKTQYELYDHGLVGDILTERFVKANSYRAAGDQKKLGD